MLHFRAVCSIPPQISTSLYNQWFHYLLKCRKWMLIFIMHWYFPHLMSLIIPFLFMLQLQTFMSKCSYNFLDCWVIFFLFNQPDVDLLSISVIKSHTLVGRVKRLYKATNGGSTVPYLFVFACDFLLQFTALCSRRRVHWKLLDNRELISLPTLFFLNPNVIVILTVDLFF